MTNLSMAILLARQCGPWPRPPPPVPSPPHSAIFEYFRFVFRAFGAQMHLQVDVLVRAL